MFLPEENNLSPEKPPVPQTWTGLSVINGGRGKIEGKEGIHPLRPQERTRLIMEKKGGY